MEAAAVFSAVSVAKWTFKRLRWENYEKYYLDMNLYMKHYFEEVPKSVGFTIDILGLYNWQH